MSLLTDTRRMREAHPSPWLVAWSRVMTTRSVRVRRYLRMSPDERRGEYPWLYKERSRKRGADETTL